MTLAELHKKATAISLAAFAFSLTSTGQNRADGFYKDIFMDSGIYLTSRVDLPAARFLNMSMEEFVSTSHKDTTTSLSAIDTGRTNCSSIIIGNSSATGLKKVSRYLPKPCFLMPAVCIMKNDMVDSATVTARTEVGTVNSSPAPGSKPQ